MELSIEQWEALGIPTMYGWARKRVEKIRAGPEKTPLPDDMIGNLKISSAGQTRNCLRKHRRYGKTA